MRRALVVLIAALCSGAAHAQSLAVDPNRPVRGSCGEVLAPLFGALRAAPMSGPMARMEVNVTRTRVGEAGWRAAARTVAAQGFTPEAEAQIHAAFAAAYERPEQEGCIGVITRRSNWIVRKGAADALWSPDNPVVINRPVAATTTPDGATRIEMIDPELGQSRITSLRTSAARCYPLEPWRDSGVLPPISEMQRGQRYPMRFWLDADGAVGQIRLPVGVTEESALGAALIRYVRRARYYPFIGENCRPEAKWVVIAPYRPA